MIEVDFSQALDRLQKIVNDVIRATPNILLGIIVFLAFMVLGNITRRVIKAGLERSRYRRNQNLVLGRLSQWLIIIFGATLTLVLVFPNFSVTELIQLFGLGSVAVGFAFRDVLQNFLVGIILLLSEPFRIRDQIIAGDHRGTVKDINTRATTIRTYDGQRVVIPNNDLYKNPVTVQTAFDRCRIDISIHITYDSDLDVAKDLILQAVYEADKEDVLSSPPPTVIVSRFDDYYVNLVVRWWIKPPLYHHMVRSRDLIYTAIKRKLDGNNRVHLAVPEHRVRLQENASVEFNG